MRCVGLPILEFNAASVSHFKLLLSAVWNVCKLKSWKGSRQKHKLYTAVM